MQRDVLIELRARVVEAKGADREIDKTIFRLFGGTIPWRSLSKPLQGHPEWVGGPSTNAHWIPFFSDSIDAAITLVMQVLPGFYTNIQPWFYADGERVTSRVTLVRPRWPDYRPSSNDWFDNYEAEAATPALAIVLATIDALLAQETAHG